MHGPIPSPPKTWSRFLKKLAFAVVVNVAIMGGIDWIVGWIGPPYHVEVARKERLSQAKAPGEKRIFVYGESTVFGWPYGDSNSTARWLELVLAEVLPGQKPHCVNFGRPGRGTAHLHDAVTRTVGYQPDLVVLCMGHNEFLPYSHPFVQHPLHRWFYFNSNVYRQLNDAVGRNRVKQAWSTFPGIACETKLHQDIVANFRTKMDEMVAAAQNRSVPVVLCIPAANLAGQHPCGAPASDKLDPASMKAMLDAETLAWLGEWHPGAEFDELFSKLSAAGFDAHAHFLAGKRLETEGRHEDAYEEYVRSKDRDLLSMRCKSEEIQILRDLSVSRKVPLVDLPATFSDHDGHDRAPGLERFVDAMHPRPIGQYMMAVTIAKQICASGILSSNADDWKWERLPSFETCARKLHDEEGWRGPDREALYAQLKTAPAQAAEFAGTLPPLVTSPDPEWTAFRTLALWKAERPEAARSLWATLTPSQQEQARTAAAKWAEPVKPWWDEMTAKLP